jgi:hypothetical protein
MTIKVQILTPAPGILHYEFYQPQASFKADMLAIQPPLHQSPPFIVHFFILSESPVIQATKYSIIIYTITKYSITKYTITKYSITKYTITKYRITKYTITT